MRDRFDIVIIGGGIHGAGVAFLASARGYDVLLLEKHELAHATSSRSSKLVHGGLRYLETAQFSLVRESLAERAWHLKRASSLVRLRPFVIPVYRGQRRGPLTIRAGLSLYALLAGLSPEARFRSHSLSSWMKQEAQARAGLATDGLRRVFVYADAQTDDAALTRAVAARAGEWGATILTGAEFAGAARAEKGGWSVTFRGGAETTDGAPAETTAPAEKTPQAETTVHAGAIVNAAGPWVNEVVKRIDPGPRARPIDLVQGAHVLVPGSLGESIYYLEAPEDGRAVFAMPWNGDTLVGTTETVHAGPPGEAAPTPDEERYLLNVITHYFPRFAGDSPPSILRSFAGLRVLPASGDSPFRRSRETGIEFGDFERAPVVSLYGGKLTTWRATAAEVLDRLLANGSLDSRPAREADPGLD